MSFLIIFSPFIFFSSIHFYNVSRTYCHYVISLSYMMPSYKRLVTFETKLSDKICWSRVVARWWLYENIKNYCIVTIFIWTSLSDSRTKCDICKTSNFWIKWWKKKWFLMLSCLRLWFLFCHLISETFCEASVIKKIQKPAVIVSFIIFFFFINTYTFVC